MPRPRGELIICLVLVLSLGACDAGGGAGSEPVADTTQPPGPSDTTADFGDPCSFLTAEELALAVGVEFDEPSEPEGMDGTCIWRSSDPAGEVILFVGDDGDFDDRLAARRDEFADLETLEVPGADAAFTADNGRIVGVDVGNSLVELTLTIEGLEEGLDRTRQLVGMAVGKLEPQPS